MRGREGEWAKIILVVVPVLVLDSVHMCSKELITGYRLLITWRASGFFSVGGWPACPVAPGINGHRCAGTPVQRHGDAGIWRRPGKKPVNVGI